MQALPKSVENVIEHFSKLPGVGPKSAARMTYHYLRAPNQDAVNLADALKEMASKVKNCKNCYNISEEDVCQICSHQLRDHSKICVVEEPLDISAFENSAIYNGLYFVLGGVISPADGIGPEELRFAQLKKRVKELIDEHGTSGKDGKVEVIVATNPSLEGEATASYLQDHLADLIREEKITVSRLAMGLPTGADLEYADRLTLKRSFEGRRGI